MRVNDLNKPKLICKEKKHAFTLDYTQPSGPGYVYANHRTHVGELAGELLFSFNRLKENHNVHLGLYGGIGLDWSYTELDQAGEFGGQYNVLYESIDPSATTGSILNTLESGRDGIFETTADDQNSWGRLGFMPSVGFELGYWVHPRVLLYGGHRVTFSLDDYLDGQRFDNAGALTDDNDLYHYTNLGLRFVVEPGRSDLCDPDIAFTRPRYSPFTTRRTNYRVEAELGCPTLTNADIVATFNGRNFYDFSYSAEQDYFAAELPLQLGKNTFTVRANGPGGSDQQTMVIYREAEQTTPAPRPTPNPTPVPGNPTAPTQDRAPDVRFTRPDRTNSVADNRYQTVRATVRNVDRRSDIQFYVNGFAVTNFSFNANTDRFEAQIELRDGRNNLQLTATNSAGTDRDNATIELNTCTERRPVISTLRLSDDGSITARMTNVTDRNQIELQYNNRRVTSYDYNRSSGRLTARVDLRDGRNEVRLQVQNCAGSDERTNRLDYDDCREPAPSVRIDSWSVAAQSPGQPVSDVGTLRATARNVADRQDIVLTLNGKRVTDFDYQPGSGRITALVKLTDGRNSIRVAVSNCAGSDDTERNFDYDGCTDLSPAVMITSLAIPSQSPGQPPSDRATLRAETSDVRRKSDITLRLNGQRTTDFDFNSSTGRITAIFKLRDGRNVAEIEVTNCAGTAEDENFIDFSDCTEARPTARIVSLALPTQSPGQPVSDKATLRAETTGISRKADITLRLNGQRTTDFDFNSSTGRITAIFKLSSGRNSVSVRVENCAGADSADRNLDFEEQQTPAPEVRITSPRNGSATDESRVSFEGRVENAQQRDLTLRLNGNTIRDFAYRNGRVTATLSLQEGPNRIELRASNAGGSDAATANVTYRKPAPKVQQPSVSFTKPGRSGQSTTNARYTFKATSREISAKSQVSVELNGSRVRSFSFSPRNGSITFTSNLEQGSNQVRITVTNDAGSATATTTVTRKADRPDSSQRPGKGSPGKDELSAPNPTVNITSFSLPAQSPGQAPSNQATLRATLTNVSRTRDVQVLVNGRAIRNYQYNTRTGALVATIAIGSGKTTVVVKANTTGGRAQDSRTIDR